MAQHDFFATYVTVVGKLEIEGTNSTVEAFQVGSHHGGLCEKRGDNCCATSKALRQEHDQLDVGFLLCSICGSWQFYFKIYAQSVRTSVSGIKLGGQ